MLMSVSSTSAVNSSVSTPWEVTSVLPIVAVLAISLHEPEGAKVRIDKGIPGTLMIVT